MNIHKSSTSEDNEVARRKINRKHPPLKKRIVQWLIDYRWVLTAIVWVATVILGYIGYSKFFLATGAAGALWDTLYNTLRLFMLSFEKVPGQLNTELQIARFLAPVVGLYTVVQALAEIFHEQLEFFRMTFVKNHIVICGLGRKGMLLASAYRALGEYVIVIESDKQNKLIQNCKERGVAVLIGDAADPDLLRKARVHQAKHVISVTGDDGTNAEVAIYVRELAPSIKAGALSCLAHIVDLQLWSFLREFEMRMGKVAAFRLGFFNVYESGARELLYEFPPFTSVNQQELSPHILVIGMGRMGESLVLNAARRWRYSNTANSGHLRITLIDKEARGKKESLCQTYPQIAQICELIPIDIDVNSPAFEKGEFLFDQDGHCDIRMIYVCLGDERVALTTALKLRKRLRPLEIPTVVRMNTKAGLSTLLANGMNLKKSIGNVYAFPLFENTCMPDVIWGGCTYEILARAIHEDYIRNAVERGESPQTNPSMVPWEDLPESLKESNRDQAEHISVKLERFGYDFIVTRDWEPPLLRFSRDEVEEMAIMEHQRFVEERLRQGWRTGSSKDAKKKISTTFVPYDELSEEEKDKDRNTVRTIPEFLAKVGYQIYRLPTKENKPIT